MYSLAEDGLKDLVDICMFDEKNSSLSELMNIYSSQQALASMYELTQQYPTSAGSGVSSINDYRNYVVKQMIEHPIQM